MRAVVQRVSEASVRIDGSIHAAIGSGVLIFVGIETLDQEEDADWLAGKIPRLRIFPDGNGVMNLSLLETGGEALVISQFTLHAAMKKGNRPSYMRAAPPDVAVPLYEHFLERLAAAMERPVAAGVFGADMKVALVNDGPVTLLMDSRRRE